MACHIERTVPNTVLDFFSPLCFCSTVDGKSFARRVVYIFLLASLVAGLGGVQSTVERRIASDRLV